HHIFNTDGSVWPGQDAGWLGYRSDPWLLNCEPAAQNMSVAQFELAADMTLDRFGQRRSLLAQIEEQRRRIDGTNATLVYTAQQHQAFDLLTSPQARASCDLMREAEPVRDRYGRSQF